ncbi:3-oxoacyl-[acyl-carrier-protein] synthase I [Litorimonas taeanensis]|uniref:3-oxoacyl-[acyl-carrier-protein] synthase 1 n=1 Tax=Litorimonas taeanensis TaxID=568099 RepID=A0A420WFJ6_9PROT|nr:beta-ketoacyl-ACP synthase I [Litorimonas taeanensis]RKQ69761.1 3-oxoacyl-[acyl-carrier-protein] synthase I [Litorimonas taeanensis]
MRRVVVTGLGIVSCIGNDKASVSESLKAGKSGISKDEKMAELGFRSQISGRPDLDPKDHIHKRSMRFMADAAGWSAVAMDQAISDAGLTEDQVSNDRTGIIAGSGGPSAIEIVRAADITRKNNSPKRIGPFAVPKAMSSTVSATLATHFKIKGVNYSITSACTTSLHCIGAATEQIQWGKQDIMFAGGGEEVEWAMSSLFDAMGAMSSKYNDTPETASRAFDATRDGFVIAGGAGMVVLEDYDHAVARGAKIYAEIIGYAATSDGYDMVAPNGEGAERAMRMALEDAGLDTVDYINPHATSTPVGDIAETKAIHRVFVEGKDGETGPYISATKCLTGHSLGAAGVQEAIYTLLMMDEGFVAPSINISEMDSEIPTLNIARERVDTELKTAMSNSFGFGGTNGSVIFAKV